MNASPLHPRDDLTPLLRMEGQYAAVETALDRGRMHHAWLLCGPRGVGKSRFGYRFAQRLLSRSDATIDAPRSPTESVARLIAARSHPDFMALHREAEDGKPRRVIPIDEVRRLPEFFSKAPSHAPYRVALIDAADDLNAGGANAVLKTLEEPPPRGVLILISHAPGRLLDTIRSRCRRLNFAPWPSTELGAWIAARGGETTSVNAVAGSPGRALVRDGEAFDATEIATRDLLDTLPAVEPELLQKLVDGLRGSDGADRFASVCERLADQVHARVSSPDGSPGRGSQSWARVWERLVKAPSDVETFNLDRADAFWSLLGDLRAATSTGVQT